jgi:hypothetical protein
MNGAKAGDIVLGKAVLKPFPFKSKSNPLNSYECLLYVDGSISCNCPGWTRQKFAGERSCKHTLLVDVMKKDYLNGGTPVPVAIRVKAGPAPARRQFNLDT